MKKKYNGRLQEIINVAKSVGWEYSEYGNEEFAGYNDEYMVTYSLHYLAPTGLGSWFIPIYIETKMFPNKSEESISFGLLREIAREQADHYALKQMLFSAADISNPACFFEEDDPQKAIQDYCTGTAAALWNGELAFEELCRVLKEKHFLK